MKKVLKKIAVTGLAGAMLMNGSMSVFAGTWKTGEGANQNKWWYDFDNGTYAANGWYWIDGNNDGVAECYYFDADGWLLANTTTPDGFTVNANGAWEIDGVIQTETRAVDDNHGEQNNQAVEQGEISDDPRDYPYMFEEVPELTEEEVKALWGESAGCPSFTEVRPEDLAPIDPNVIIH